MLSRKQKQLSSRSQPNTAMVLSFPKDNMYLPSKLQELNCPRDKNYLQDMVQMMCLQWDNKPHLDKLHKSNRFLHLLCSSMYQPCMQ